MGVFWLGGDCKVEVFEMGAGIRGFTFIEVVEDFEISLRGVLYWV